MECMRKDKNMAWANIKNKMEIYLKGCTKINNNMGVEKFISQTDILLKDFTKMG